MSEGFEARQTGGLIPGSATSCTSASQASLVLPLGFPLSKLLKTPDGSQLTGLPGLWSPGSGPLHPRAPLLRPGQSHSGCSLLPLLLPLSGTPFWMFCIWSTLAHPLRFSSSPSLNGSRTDFPGGRVHTVYCKLPDPPNTHPILAKIDLRQP